jgi:hypothetical protein
LNRAPNGNIEGVATVAQLQTCDGFTVESPDGCLGWVEETWLGADGHPAALAVRTADGRRALLLTDEVLAVDPDAQEVLVGEDADLRALEPPRLTSADTATWHATDEHLKAMLAAAHTAPSTPALAAARAATSHRDRPVWQSIATALGCIATLVAVEIGLAFGIAFLVTGNPPY